MKKLLGIMLVGVVCVAALPAFGQAVRQDAIWARVSPTPITLDGVLDEPGWAAAETKVAPHTEPPHLFQTHRTTLQQKIVFITRAQYTSK